jgi:endonuclease/exonuclease/phosphatase family metal-dependent hydrolase
MTNFSLLTLNCYGVPAPGTARRLSLLADTLNTESLSAVCLQEVQSNRYCKQLQRACTSYPASAFEPFIHAPKGGLLTLSQYPIDQAEFMIYEERGLWYTPALADWILHKGILISRMDVSGVPVVLINTHLTANYTGDWNRTNPYAKHEHLQLQQLAKLVQEQPDESLVLVCGDFNIPRGSWLYDYFLYASGLSDPLAGDMQPTLRPRWVIPARYFMPIDFAFVRAPHHTAVTAESRLRFEERVLHDGRHLHLSDHYGVELQLNW